MKLKELNKSGSVITCETKVVSFYPEGFVYSNGRQTWIKNLRMDMGYEAVVFHIYLIDVEKDSFLVKMNCEHARGGTYHTEYKFMNLKGIIIGSYSSQEFEEPISDILNKLKIEPIDKT